MKFIYILVVGTLFFFGANAQNADRAAFSVNEHTRAGATVINNAPHHRSAGRTTATTFVTEDFGTGTDTSMPTGWSTGSLAVGRWRWRDTASRYSSGMGAIASTTASNGWMIFDSDSVGIVTGGSPASWLQSARYNCSAHATVRLNFEEYFRRYYDSCFIWVSYDSNFRVHTVFPIPANNTLPINSYTANPAITHVDITSAAAGHDSVFVWFMTYGPKNGAYSWMIDDMSLSEMDATDLGVRRSCMVYNFGATKSAFGTIPSSLADSLSLISYGDNYGATSYPAASIVAKIYQGPTLVNTITASSNLPTDALDSMVNFASVAPPYFTNTVGSYFVPVSVTVAGDADLSNNADTARFAVTDSTWSENTPGSKPNGSVIVNRPDTSTAGLYKLSFSPATQFSLPAGKSDTLTTVSVAFTPNTKPGQVVGVQLFRYDSSKWNYIGQTVFRALTPAEISDTATIRYATFPVNLARSGYIVLNGGSAGIEYAAVVKGDGNTDSVEVYTSENPAPVSVIGYTGHSDTSNNDGQNSVQFGQGHVPFSEPYTPFINLNFGTVPPNYTAVHDVNIADVIGSAYPNPVTGSLSIPITIAQDAVVTITLYDIAGQAIKAKSYHATGGRPMKADMLTGDLPDGVYLYSVLVNGRNTNGRIVITH